MTAGKKAELTIQCAHKPGELAKILETLTKAGVNVLAIAGYLQGDRASIMLVPDNAEKAGSALKKGKIAFAQNTVLVLTGSSGPGQGAKVARRLADAGVNLEYAYASTSGSGDGTFVFGNKDLDKGLAALS